MLPSINSCETPTDILALNGRLVRFECMIQDMYEEEYFGTVLRKHDSQDLNYALLYKYYSELSQEQIDSYDC